jgi:ribonucleoside-diphosphate reductase alpha chain
VPFEVYVSKFAHMRFEPSGVTNDPDIRAAKSIVDYLFSSMGKKLSVGKQEEIGILSPEMRARLAEGYRNCARSGRSSQTHERSECQKTPE